MFDFLYNNQEKKMFNIKDKIILMLEKDMEEFRQRVMTPDGAMLVFMELLLCSFIGAMIGFAISKM